MTIYKITNKLNISNGHKGQIAWNKNLKTGKPAYNRGKPMSKEQKLKISLSLKNRVNRETKQ